MFVLMQNVQPAYELHAVESVTFEHVSQVAAESMHVRLLGQNLHRSVCSPCCEHTPSARPPHVGHESVLVLQKPVSQYLQPGKLPHELLRFMAAHVLQGMRLSKQASEEEHHAQSVLALQSNKVERPVHSLVHSASFWRQALFAVQYWHSLSV